MRSWSWIAAILYKSNSLWMSIATLRYWPLGMVHLIHIISNNNDFQLMLLPNVSNEAPIVFAIDDSEAPPPKSDSRLKWKRPGIFGAFPSRYVLPALSRMKLHLYSCHSPAWLRKGWVLCSRRIYLPWLSSKFFEEWINIFGLSIMESSNISIHRGEKIQLP